VLKTRQETSWQQGQVSYYYLSSSHRWLLQPLTATLHQSNVPPWHDMTSHAFPSCGLRVFRHTCETA